MMVVVQSRFGILSDSSTPLFAMPCRYYSSCGISFADMLVLDQSKVVQIQAGIEPWMDVSTSRKWLVQKSCMIILGGTWHWFFHQPQISCLMLKVVATFDGIADSDQTGALSPVD